MTDLADNEALEQAHKLINDTKNKERQDSEDEERIRIEKKLGKFYISLGHIPKEGHHKVYRVVKKGFNDVYMETYFYHHASYYGIVIEKYNEGIGGASDGYDKEIDEITFWHETVIILNKIGCLPKINMETNH